MPNIQVKPAQSAQPLEKDLKDAGKSAIDSIRNVRNVAAGVAVTGLAAMGAEVLGVVTLPATIPTGMLTLAAAGVAGVTGTIVFIGEGVDKLVSDANANREQAIGK